MAAVSLGCSKNRIDTEEVLGYLARQGYILTDHYNSADVIFINTCAFIEQARQESIDTILKMIAGTRQNEPKIFAAGCLVEVFGDKILKKIPELDGAIGVHSYRDLDQFMAKLFAGEGPVMKNSPPDTYRSLSPRVLTTPVYSASVKIAEGCNNRCRYCLIPEIRGPYRSRAPEEIVSEIKGLLEQGTFEINILAQDTTAYGTDGEAYPDLCGLLNRILDLDFNFWLRIMYTYPSRITDQLIDLVREENRICSYLDVPIQHSSDRLLERMGRLYRRHNLTALFDKLRFRIPDLALRTTVMVGHPGETRKQFLDLLSFIEDYPFENLGAFTYSPRENNYSGSPDRQVAARVAGKRYRELMTRQKKIARLANQKYLGMRLPILVEGANRKDPGWYYGRTEYQAPEVDGSVFFRSPAGLEPGSLVSAVIKAAGPYNLLAVNPVPLDRMPR